MIAMLTNAHGASQLLSNQHAETQIWLQSFHHLSSNAPTYQLRKEKKKSRRTQASEDSSPECSNTDIKVESIIEVEETTEVVKINQKDVMEDMVEDIIEEKNKVRKLPDHSSKLNMKKEKNITEDMVDTEDMEVTVDTEDMEVTVDMEDMEVTVNQDAMVKEDMEVKADMVNMEVTQDIMDTRVITHTVLESSSGWASWPFTSGT